jgi:type I restriction enzyme, R subunit
LLLEGVPVEFQDPKKGTVHDDAKLIDFDNPGNNEFLAVNQFTVIEKQNRRPDIVVFINGLPLGVIELKSPSSEEAEVKGAFNQLQTYKHDIPTLFRTNQVLAVSDGWNARVGTLSSDWEWFMPWRMIDGSEVEPPTVPQSEVLVRGLFERSRLLDYIRSFIVFEDDGANIIKKAAGYHQYHAVNKAVQKTLEASRPQGDRKIGVVWHTQGSGKSLSMAFFAGKIIQHPQMENPTLVVITDRNDLDDQLFGQFSRAKGLLRQTPQQADNRGHLRELLTRAAGGVVFTTIQKFLPAPGDDTVPKLSDRRNVVVIADEAHRSQYGFVDGFARHMRDALPNASFIGFTGTPIESDDRSTPAVFGDYIDVYDIQRAVEDKATVPIYYEGRLARLKLKTEQIPKIDEEVEEVSEGQEEELVRKAKSKWARMEALAGTPERLERVAKDLVDHFEQRQTAMDGKALIVCMSRRICVDLYNEIVKLKPHWHDDDDAKGVIKVVMTGDATDKLDMQPHIRNKPRREDLAKRMKNAKDPLKLVIVRDMWLTGFDVPCLHTMYVDKPMRGHGLMQAIARVNRVFKDKPGGLVVDYLGLAENLKRALRDYTLAGGRGNLKVDQDEAVEVMLEKYEIVRDMFHGFDYMAVVNAPKAARMQGAKDALDFILKPSQPDESPDERKKAYFKAVTELSKAFALSVPREEAIEIRDEVAFFQAVKAGVAKLMPDDAKPVDIDAAIRQIVSKSIASDEIIDIFRSAGLGRPDISILSEELLAEVRALPQKNFALELLRKLLNDEIKVHFARNVVKQQNFSEMLAEAVLKYQNRSLAAAEVITELIQIARDVRKATQDGQELGLSDDEVAFYDALEVNDSAVKVLGEPTLKLIAHELINAVRNSVTIDWNVRESARAKIRVMIKRILKKHGYPPDKQARATELVLKQAEVICGADVK